MRGRTSKWTMPGLYIEALEPRALLSSSLDFSGPLIMKTDEQVRAAISEDLNADGIDDLALSVGNQVLVRFGRANGTLGPATTAATFNLNAGLLAAGDFDGDGHTDIAAARVAGAAGTTGPAQTWVRILRGDGSGGFTPGPLTLIGERVRSFAAAQIDVDRRMEVLINGLLLDVRGSGASEHIVVLQAVPGVVTDSAAADLDGDGRDEIVAITADPAGTTSIVIMRNLGGMAFTPASTRTFDASVATASSVAVGDVTGDGHADVVFTTSDPAWGFQGRTGYMTVTPGTLTLSDPTYVNTITEQIDGKSSEIGGRLWIVGITDFDNDGRNDILVGSTNSVFNERDHYLERGAGLTRLIAQSDGTFKPYGVGGVFRVASDSTTPDELPLYFLYAPAGTGVSHGPDVLVLDRDGYNRSRLSRLPNTQAWKPPVVVYSIGSLILEPVSGSPYHYENPARRLYVGDRVGLYAYGATAEAPRGAGIAGLRFTIDSNHNRVLDAADVVLGDGVNDEGDRWHLFDYVDADWTDAESNGMVTVFVAAMDNTGVTGPARSVNFTILTL